MKSVLVPIDGSECSLRALHYLIGARAGDRGPALHLLNVQPAMTGDVRQFVARSDIDDYRRAQSDEALRPARDLLDGAGLAYESHLDVGHAADCIIRCAEALGCDHIVMGTHGRSALADLLVSSTTLKVLHQTRLPVVLVK
jgi:nucleotide-binding universal stress UspA family protein